MSPHRMRAAHERCADLVHRWLTACAKDSCRWRVEALALTDDELADALIAAWGLDQPHEGDNDITWFEQHSPANRAMLVEAFAAFRDELNKRE